MFDNENIYAERSNEDAFQDRYGVKPSTQVLKEAFKPKSPEDLSDSFDDNEEEENYQ